MTLGQAAVLMRMHIVILTDKSDSREEILKGNQDLKSYQIENRKPYFD